MKMSEFQINLNEVCSSGSNQQYSSIGLDDVALTRQQTIIWTNVGLFTDVNMHHLASMS